MKLEVGKTYRNRFGQLVKIIEHIPENNIYTYKVRRLVLGDWYTVTEKGEQFFQEESPLDLMEEVKEPMKLEVGKKYRTRKGTTVKIVEYFPDNEIFKYKVRKESNGDWYTITDEGKQYTYEESPLDLMEEVSSSPRTDILGLGLTMIPFHSLYRIGKIFIEGLRYGKDNWKKGVNQPDFQEERLEHAMNHLFLWKEGDRSEDHLAKVAWFCLIQMELERLEKNDE